LFRLNGEGHAHHFEIGNSMRPAEVMCSIRNLGLK
jgi:hypothetical protein